MVFTKDIINIKNFIAILGIFQGIILWFVVFRNRENKSNLYLSWFILLLSSLIFFNFYLRDLMLNYPYLVLITFVPYLFGPLLYFYFLNVLYRDYVFRIPFWIHTIPAILNFILFIILMMFFDFEEIREIINQVLKGKTPFFILMIDAGKAVSGFIYSYLILRLIMDFKLDLKQWLKIREHGFWLKNLVIYFIICWIIVFLSIILMNSWKENANINLLGELLQITSFVAFIYLITFLLIRFPEIFNKTQLRDKVRKKLNLDNKDIVQLSKTLISIMEDQKPYLDETCSLKSLAEKLNLHPNTLSFIINESFNKNFNEFLNEYRLNYFIEILDTDENSNVLNLAFASGFSSKSVFNQAFKKKYNISPREYRKINKKTS